MKAALEFGLAHPGRALEAMARSFANTWRLDYPGANPIRRLSNIVLYLGLLPFVAVGAIRGLRDLDAGPRLVAAFFIYLVIAHALLASEIRYRTAAMPAYFVLAALGASSMRRSLTTEEASS